MKYLNDFRNKEDVKTLLKSIEQISTKPVRLMEVCGGHTMAIHKSGIPSLLPVNIKLLSGPGCPVCVSDIRFIDHAIALSQMENTIITTFGDLVRVPGSYSSLEKERATGRKIKMVYSVLDAIQIARDNPDKKVIFLGIGFETTAPGTAMGILHAWRSGVKNFYVFSSHKVMPPAMTAIIVEGVKIDGYIGPGHVSAIAGLGIYKELVEKYRVGCVISGFEPVDLLHTIYMLVKQVEENDPKVEIQYKRAVLPGGNKKAWNTLTEVFEYRDDYWRGLGVLPQSGLKIKEKYAELDAERMFDVVVTEPREIKGCICGEILKGLKSPVDCKLFEKVCNPSNPVGACMVSGEGACAAFYKYDAER